MMKKLIAIIIAIAISVSSVNSIAYSVERIVYSARNTQYSLRNTPNALRPEAFIYAVGSTPAEAVSNPQPDKVIFTVSNKNMPDKKITLFAGNKNKGWVHILNRHCNMEDALAEGKTGSVYFPARLSKKQIRDIIRKTIQEGYHTYTPEQGHECFRYDLNEEEIEQTGIHVMHVGVNIKGDLGEVITARPIFGKNIIIDRETKEPADILYWEWTHSIHRSDLPLDIGINAQHDRVLHSIYAELRRHNIADADPEFVKMLSDLVKKALENGRIDARASSESTVRINYEISEPKALVALKDTVMTGISILLKNKMPYPNARRYFLDELSIRIRRKHPQLNWAFAECA